MASKRVVDLWLEVREERGRSHWSLITGHSMSSYHVIFVVPLSIHNKLVLKRTLQRQFQSGGIAACSSGNGGMRVRPNWNGMRPGSLLLHGDWLPVGEGSSHGHFTVRTPRHTQTAGVEDIIVSSKPILHRRLGTPRKMGCVGG